MGKMLGCLFGVAELLGEGKTPTQLVLKQRQAGLLQIHLGYLIILPHVPLLAGKYFPIDF